MKHVTVDEMIDFVSFEKIDRETIDLASKVNAHILKCESCRKKILAFQTIYDELLKLGKSEKFRELVKNRMSNPTSDPTPDLSEKIDGYR